LTDSAGNGGESAYDDTERHLMLGGFFANHTIPRSDEATQFEAYREWCDAATELGFGVIGIALPWNRIQPDDPEAFDWDLADRWWDYAIEAGHDLWPILDQTGVSAPEWLDTDEYAQRTPDGKVVTTHGGNAVLTLHSETLNEHITRYYRAVAEHLVERYGHDRILALQNVTWPNMESTYPGDIDFTDYSDHAHQAFREWVTDRYDSVAELNRTWGTSLDDFDDVTVGTETAAKANDVRKFRAWGLAEHVEQQYRAVKAVDPRLGYALRSGGADDWTDAHGEKTSLVAATYCDVIGEDNEYARPFMDTMSFGQSADLNYYRTGARLRDASFNMEMDYLDKRANGWSDEAADEEYRENGLYGFDTGAQILNMCHWEPGTVEDYDDPSVWTFAPVWEAAADQAVSEFRPRRAYYYSYWGGLADREVSLRETYSNHTLYGDPRFADDVLAAPQFVDPTWESIETPGWWNGYDRGIWVPDSRVLSAVERDALTQAYRDGTILSLSRPQAVGTSDEYGHETDPLVAALRAIGEEQGTHNASVDFRATAASNWSYGLLQGDTVSALEYDAASGLWTGPDGRVAVGPHRQRPVPGRRAVRIWEAPADGTVTLEGSVESVQKFPGGGTTGVSVLQHSGGGSVGAAPVVWPAEDRMEHVHANRPVVLCESTLTVERGDRLVFLAHALDREGDHTVDWTPQLRYE
jgi:hypothetical protein